MSHTTQHILLGTTFSIAEVQFSSYTVGGESFTLAEFGLTGPLKGVKLFQTFGDVPNNTAQFVDLTNISTGIIKLLNTTSPLTEFPTGPCNYSFTLLAIGS